MIHIIDRAIDPQEVLNDLKANDSGSLVMHIGIMRPSSEGKKVSSIEYKIDKGGAKRELNKIAGDIKGKWQVQDIALLRTVGEYTGRQWLRIIVPGLPQHEWALLDDTWNL